MSKQFISPPATVFAAVTDIPRTPERIPEIKKIEMLTEGPIGLDTKFQETRIMFGKEAVETFEIVEFIQDRLMTMVAVSCGAEYRVEHRFHADGAGTRMELELQIRARSFYAKLFRPLGWLMRGMMKKGIAKDLDRLAAAVDGKQAQPVF